VELARALRLKQAREEPMAIFIGAFKANEKAGTKTAPVPIPKSPGRRPAAAPMATFENRDPLTTGPHWTSDLLARYWDIPSQTIRKETREKTSPMAPSSQISLCGR
jgi:hypothetical protein